MIKAIFPSGLNEIKLPAVYQWDYNRKLSIEGISTTGSVLQVHFSNEFSRVAIPRVAYKSGSEWQVNIPNALLQDRYNIYAYIFLNDAESGKVEKKIIIPVKARPMPDDYPQNSYEEDELNRLISYTNTLGSQVAHYSNELAGYKNKKWVKECTRDEYNAWVDAGTIEEDVLYCFTDITVGEPGIISEVIYSGTAEFGYNVALGGYQPAVLEGVVLEAGYRYTALAEIQKNGEVFASERLYTACSFAQTSGNIIARFVGSSIVGSNNLSIAWFEVKCQNGNLYLLEPQYWQPGMSNGQWIIDKGTFKITIRKHEYVG